ncbi:2-oxoglutarate dehydrogenase, E2 component, dihydrolipoamide succinyltransferase [Pseudonocardia asaccharolytica]|uniref:Dihydrolipoamide acetyltransferase component of pyruvate dehydrogenase complex n=1 Tax=Pseudonocardia asaccharolytica DSM 44247 = NBRC 16224 TaxID=1123024 RepID=A0A511D100_9PSEU|nr:2-oxoglutarate dehydrogenase, E2 component, dihydrolipoamide succinyltransferase [Pseudonocardia asaccharolytica]GEL18470.1 dihydrolipoamide acetyltransferase component of pyruvate dehydrogenase complex [Pseudonocardia asaccharolytica DSM 44247 = NBRC 16224]
MAFSVQMPALGESVTEGTVTRWLKQEGDRVEVDEPLLEISTDKVDTEIPSPAAGILQRIIAAEDEIVEVGGELAVIGEASQDTAEAGGDAAAQARPEAEAAPEPEPVGAAAQVPEPQQAPVADAPSAASGTPVVMPELGESVTEGTVTRWLKQVGDTIAVDEPLLEISTDKVDTEIPSPVAGTVLEIVAAEDETVEVGGQLAIVGDAGAVPSAPAPAEPTPPAPAEPAAPAQPPAEARPEPEEAGATGRPAEVDGRAGAPYVTPLVRRLAAEHGVDLGSLRGSGVGGRIRKQDVLAAAEATQQPAAQPAAPAQPSAPAPAGVPAKPTTVPVPAADGPQPGTTIKMPRLRQVIAQRMLESLQISAQLTTVQEVDVTRIVKLRAKAKDEFAAREGVKLTYLPFFAKATVEALQAFPQLNASINEETKEVTYHAAVHLAIAVDTPRGLLVPVIKNAEELSVAGLARKIADVAARTRDAKIGPDDLSGGTFTITNIGSAGALFDTPIINQPQVAILGTGAISKEPRVVPGPDGDDVIAVRSVCFLPLTYDHRLVDGAVAGRFVSTVKARLEEGAFDTEVLR